MSSSSIREEDGPPFVGALLRLGYEKVRARMDAAIREAGFTDLHDTHLLAFSYPKIDGERPSDVARRLRVSRQAANHVIGQLEDLGYLKRLSPRDGERRLVYLTERGEAVYSTIYQCLREIHAESAAEVGAERFRSFLSVLRQLADQA